jgi:hypothetical protein
MRTPCWQCQTIPQWPDDYSEAARAQIKQELSDTWGETEIETKLNEIKATARPASFYQSTIQPCLIML